MALNYLQRAVSTLMVVQSGGIDHGSRESFLTKDRIQLPAQLGSFKPLAVYARVVKFSGR